MFVNKNIYQKLFTLRSLFLMSIDKLFLKLINNAKTIIHKYFTSIILLKIYYKEKNQLSKAFSFNNSNLKLQKNCFLSFFKMKVLVLQYFILFSILITTKFLFLLNNNQVSKIFRYLKLPVNQMDTALFSLKRKSKPIKLIAKLMAKL